MKIRVSVHLLNLQWALTHRAINACCLIRIQLHMVGKLSFQHKDQESHKDQDGTEFIVTISWGQEITHVLPQPKCGARTVISSPAQTRTQKPLSVSLLHVLFPAWATQTQMSTYIIKAAHNEK